MKWESVDRLYLIDTALLLELCDVRVRLDQHDVTVLSRARIDEAGGLLEIADARLNGGRLVFLIVG